MNKNCEKKLWLCVDVWMYIFMQSESAKNICINIVVSPSPLSLHVCLSVCKAPRAFKDRRLKITNIIIIIDLFYRPYML